MKIALLLSFLTIGGVLNSQTHINGSIIDAETKKPLQGAVIKFHSGGPQKYTTASDGDFYFNHPDNLPPSAYFKFSVQLDGYEYVDREFEVHKYFTIEMKRIKSGLSINAPKVPRRNSNGSENTPTRTRSKAQVKAPTIVSVMAKDHGAKEITKVFDEKKGAFISGPTDCYQGSIDYPTVLRFYEGDAVFHELQVK